MKPKKNKIIIIAIIVVSIIILVAGAAVAYLATDLFKSDKELFFKYITQIGDEKNGLLENSLKEYFNKQKTTPYTDQGSFSLAITSEENQEVFQNINNFNISFSGQVDTANSKALQDISINYSDSVNFPISYKQIQETIGLQTKYVGSKFVAVETNNLNKLSGGSTLEQATDSLEKIEEITQVFLSEEEIKQIQETYVGVLNQQLNNTSFSKVKENNSNGYRLTLTGEELKNVLVQLLETLKSDQATLDKINEYLKTQKNSAKITVSMIENQIKGINQNTELADDKFEITVYSQNGRTNKITIGTQEGTMAIEKRKENNTLTMGISYETSEEPTKIALTAIFEGLETMQNVHENYQLEIQFEPPTGILEQAQTAKNDTKKTEEEETLNLLVAAIRAKKLMNTTNYTGGTDITAEDIEKEISEKQEYSKLAVKEIANKEIQVTFTDTKDIFVIDSAGTVTNKTETTENTDTEANGTVNYKYQYNNQVTFTDSVTIEDFTNDNAMILTNYEQEQVSNFLQAVSERITQVNKEQMGKLGLEEDENPIFSIFPTFGIYNSALKVVEQTDFDKEVISVFNQKFEMYASTNQKGATVKGLLTVIGINNSSDEEKQIKEINFDGKEYEATEQNIAFIKEDIDTGKSYRVEFEKDQDTGMIYRAVINPR